MTTLDVLRRRARKGACVLLTTAFVAGFWMIADVPQAGATCNGVGAPRIIPTPSSLGPAIGTEEARGSTCDNDKVYYLGLLKDTKADGYCVTAQVYDGGVVTTVAKSCNSTGTAFTYTDPGRDGQSYMRVCIPIMCTDWYYNFGY